MPLQKFIHKAIGIVAFSLLFSVSVAHPATIEELEQSLQKLQERNNELSRRSQQFRSLVEETNREIKGIQGEIQTLSYQIGGLEIEIERTQNEIDRTRLQIEKLGLEVEKVLGQIDTAKVQTSEVLKRMYQAEQVSPIEIVLSGRNFSDFWDQHQYFSSFQTALNNLIFQMEVLKKDLDEKIIEQSAKHGELTQLEEQKNIQKTYLAQERSQQGILLAQSKTEREQYQAELTSAEKERKRIIEEILKIEEEVKRLRNFEFYIKSGKIPPPGTKIFTWPSGGTILTQGYGRTSFASSGRGGYTFHNGIDVGGAVGTPIFAAAPGKVIGRNSGACPNNGGLRNFGCEGGWGNWIAIQHEGDLVTLYAHMAKPSWLAVGNTVQSGQNIGFVGSSGNVTGPHLHFSLYTEFFLVPKGYPGYNPEGTLNPLLYL